jgi:hypothetical protein
MQILGSLLALSIVVISSLIVRAEPPPKSPAELMALSDAVVIAVVKLVEPLEPDPISETQRESVSFRIEQVEKGVLEAGREFRLIFDSSVLATSDLPSNFQVDDRYRLYLAKESNGELSLFGSDGMERIPNSLPSETMPESNEPPRPVRQARERFGIKTDPIRTLSGSGITYSQAGYDPHLLPKSMLAGSSGSDGQTENATGPKLPPHPNWMTHFTLPDPDQAPPAASPLKNWWDATVDLLAHVGPKSKGEFFIYLLVLYSIVYCAGKLRSWLSPKVR